MSSYTERQEMARNFMHENGIASASDVTLHYHQPPTYLIEALISEPFAADRCIEIAPETARGIRELQIPSVRFTCPECGQQLRLLGDSETVDVQCPNDTPHIKRRWGRFADFQSVDPEHIQIIVNSAEQLKDVEALGDLYPGDNALVWLRLGPLTIVPVRIGERIPARFNGLLTREGPRAIEAMGLRSDLFICVTDRPHSRIREARLERKRDWPASWPQD